MAILRILLIPLILLAHLIILLLLTLPIKGGTVAIIDRGIDYTHPDLADNVIGGYSVYEPHSNFFDGPPRGGHGTKVAGVIQNVFPDVKLVGVKVILDEFDGISEWGIKTGLQWVEDNVEEYGINVVNISLSNDKIYELGEQEPVYEEHFKRLNELGVTIVVAAGNSYHQYLREGLGRPSASERVIPVMAMNRTEHSDFLTGWSNRHEWAIGAPGLNVDTTIPTWLVDGEYIFEPYTSFFSGTSAAAPYVSAGASMIADRLLEMGAEKWRIPFLVRDVLFLTGDDFYDVQTDKWYKAVNLDREWTYVNTQPKVPEPQGCIIILVCLIYLSIMILWNRSRFYGVNSNGYYCR